MTSPAELLPRLRTLARRLIDRPTEELSALARAGLLTVHVLVSCARKLMRDRAPQMAAALAFQTLFSLLPLLVLVILVLHSVRGLEGPERNCEPWWSSCWCRQSLVGTDVDLVGPPVPGGPATLQEFNDARAVLRRRVDDVIETLSGVSFAGLGIAGFLLFVYGATSLMRTVENGFNILYQADDPPPWSRLAPYFTLLTLGPFALVGRAGPAGSPARESRHLHGWLVGGAVRLRRSAAGVLRRARARVPHHPQHLGGVARGDDRRAVERCRLVRVPGDLRLLRRTT